MSAENERKALHAQLSNERLISSNMRNELERETELRSIEKNELEIEKVGQMAIGAQLFSGCQLPIFCHFIMSRYRRS
jgi:hypothetical protein